MPVTHSKCGFDRRGVGIVLVGLFVERLGFVGPAGIETCLFGFEFFVDITTTQGCDDPSLDAELVVELAEQVIHFAIHGRIILEPLTASPDGGRGGHCQVFAILVIATTDACIRMVAVLAKALERGSEDADDTRAVDFKITCKRSDEHVGFHTSGDVGMDVTELELPVIVSGVGACCFATIISASR